MLTLMLHYWVLSPRLIIVSLTFVRVFVALRKSFKKDLFVYNSAVHILMVCFMPSINKSEGMRAPSIARCWLVFFELCLLGSTCSLYKFLCCGSLGISFWIFVFHFLYACVSVPDYSWCLTCDLYGLCFDLYCRIVYFCLLIAGLVVTLWVKSFLCVR